MKWSAILGANWLMILPHDACDVTLSVYPHRVSLKNMSAKVWIEPTTFGILAHLGKHIFQAYQVWIYTQSNITSIIFTWVHYTNTEKIHDSSTCYHRTVGVYRVTVLMLCTSQFKIFIDEFYNIKSWMKPIEDFYIIYLSMIVLTIDNQCLLSLQTTRL
jgi:hypothetical protein